MSLEEQDEDRHLSDEEYGDWNWTQMLESLEDFAQSLLQVDDWGYPSSVELVQAQRFVWFASLARCTRKFLEGPFDDERSAQQILGYVSLRSLCEYLLKVYVLTHVSDYESSDKHFKNSDGSMVPAMNLTYEQLKQTFRFLHHEEFEEYLTRIQQRGNAIHSYRNRTIGNYSELCADIRHFAAFFDEVSCSIGRFIETRKKIV
jgi:hypothetical protein